MYLPFCFPERKENIPDLDVRSGSTNPLDFSMTTGATLEEVSAGGFGFDESSDAVDFGRGGDE